MSADLLRRYVESHNRGVRSGDFSAMLRLFDDNAELHFDGAPIGPFVGTNAIRGAFATHPPDDELELVDVQQTDATYGWQRGPSQVSGALHFEFNGDKIKRLIVTFRS